MNSTQTPSETDPQTAAPGWQRALYERQVELLGELAELGVAGARDVARLSKDSWCVEGVEIAAVAHNRLARAVRMTLMLQSRVIRAIEALERAQAQAGADRPPVMARKALVGGIVGRVARASATGDEIERLAHGVTERLDHEALFGGGLMARPVSELVQMICVDLGLDPDWAGLAQEDWARDEMADGPVGRPLAQLLSQPLRPPVGPLLFDQTAAPAAPRPYLDG